jgi:hypothetical protein
MEHFIFSVHVQGMIETPTMDMIVDSGSWSGWIEMRFSAEPLLTFYNEFYEVRFEKFEVGEKW